MIPDGSPTLMANLFLLSAGAILLLLYRWLFRVLPGARWQFLAVLPHKKLPDGSWSGVNLTFYGFFSATAGATAVACFILLAGSAGADLSVMLLLTVCVLAACLPAAKIIATRVEKNPHGFTVGGASFVGIILAPVLLWLMDDLARAWFETALPVWPLLAAMAIAYVLGEGIGRLGCISFGCCYGRPLEQLSPTLRKWLAPHTPIYEGETKKIYFAGGLGGCKVVPIQAITCSFYTLLALAGMALFFQQQFVLAFLLALLGSQLWRLYSETLRADFRGQHKQVSVYQAMALGACLWALAISIILPAPGMAVDIHSGMVMLWQPAVLLALQGIWVLMFVYSGSSTITRSQLHFRLAPDWQSQAGCDAPATARGASRQPV